MSSLEEVWAFREETLYPQLFGVASRGIFPLDIELFSQTFEQNEVDPRWLHLGIFEFAPTAGRPSWLYVSSGGSTPWETEPGEYNIDNYSWLGVEFVMAAPAQADWPIRALQRLLAYQVLLAHGRLGDYPPLDYGHRIPVGGTVDGSASSKLTFWAIAKADHYPSSATLPSGNFDLACRRNNRAGARVCEGDIYRGIDWESELRQRLPSNRPRPPRIVVVDGLRTARGQTVRHRNLGLAAPLFWPNLAGASMSAKRLLSVIYANAADLSQQVQAFIANGTDLDGVNEHGESPLRVASNNGRFEVVAMLVDAGANWYELAWTNTIQQTVFGTLDSVRASVLEHRDLEKKDVWGRTPFLIAVLLGDTAKAELLLELGAEPNSTGIGGKRAPAYAIQRGDLSMLQWLVEQGFDMEARDDFGNTPLMEAAASGQVECVRFLARHGVDLYKTGNTDQRALEMAIDMAVVRALMEYGDDVTDLSDEAHAELLGVEYDGEPSCARAELVRHGARVFGTANPQRTNYPFWLEMIRCGANAWRARDRVGGDDGIRPVWCYQRFGRSTTILPDGRIVDIGGEHEDFYDPDFCIYNDVVVGDGKGHAEIYSYPTEIFPPTDFHSATLAGNDIYIIGCLGYHEQRRPGYTPVYKLDLSTFRIKALATRGECPGWIYKHKARLIGTGAVAISGGFTENGNTSTQSVANEDIYSLCLDSLEWTRLPPR